MRPLRRWVPGPARHRPGAAPAADHLPLANPADGLDRDAITAKDLTFCAEFAVHGGVAVSSAGFKGEGELLRMQRRGLLDLERDPAPPFPVTRVALSAAARQRLSGPSLSDPGRERGAAERGAASRRAPWAAATDQEASSLNTAGLNTASLNTASLNTASLRRGFEVARGMISAAVKAELASWRARGEAGGGAGLETRVMTRISHIEVPFER